ncbi:O-methyltransferase I [Azotobacter chroococcum NCIMB 8003]|uniref:O-methyltransferase I n=2 Tax=Azotobacter chroococcum TaxID=353 RepID=A0A0C4WUG2_9GAMM|nr:O-methyltransferase I [Azotobacter chroococcum NCIMB 8003]
MPSITLKDHYVEHEGLLSDKWDIYLSEYERLFRSQRQTPVTILEIGVQNGGSLEIWGKYFPNASTIIGCDINPRCENITYTSDKTHLVIGDINQPQTLEKIFSITQEFDLVIDDGSHTSSDIIGTFCNFFPRLKHGGLYIAEDLHCSYWEDYEGGLHHPRSSMAFFKALADVLNFEHWGIEHSRVKLLQAFGISAPLGEVVLAEIHSIEFVNSMCIITKHPAASNRLGKRYIAGKSALVCDIKNTHGTYIGVPSQDENKFSTSKIANNDQTPPKKTPRNRPLTLAAKIYWHEKQGNAASGYSEVRSSAAKYSTDGERQTLTLLFPDTVGLLDSLRLDISDDLAAIILHGMRLVDSDGHELWQWSGYTNALAKVGGIAFFGDGDGDGDGEPCTLFALNDDPRFELVLPDETLAAIRPGCALLLDITPYTLASQLPRVFAQSGALAAEFRIMAEQLNTRLDQKDRLIASQKERIQRLEKNQHEQYEQLLRAESQLALLKELVVSSGCVESL